MNPQIYFWIVFLVLVFIILFFDKKYDMLRDATIIARPKPFSFARVQLAWWTLIVLASFISIILSGYGIPTFNQSTLILIGIGTATTATAKLIDLSDQSKPGLRRSQDENGRNFFLDILSDENGVSIHRFQTVAFNLIIGIWFITEVLHQLSVINKDTVNLVMPVISDNNLILLGLSSGAYAALKATENKSLQAGVINAVTDVNIDVASEEAVG
jgi:hypothetical protein